VVYTQYTNYTTIDHNLGYVPVFICFVSDGTIYTNAPYNKSTVAIGNYGQCYADTTKLYFKVWHWVASGTPSTLTITFAYKIFRNKLDFT